MPEPKLSPAESVKAASRGLRGRIAEELAAAAPSVSKDSNLLLKFHGIYQQDDRDLRKTQPTKVYGMMARVSVPGGIIPADQYLALDGLADKEATTRSASPPAAASSSIASPSRI
jgi:sulfite reductase (ferredoxin)